MLSIRAQLMEVLEQLDAGEITNARALEMNREIMSRVFDDGKKRSTLRREAGVANGEHSGRA